MKNLIAKLKSRSHSLVLKASLMASPFLAIFLAFTTPDSPDSITLSFTGDIMLHESQLIAAYDPGCDCYDFTENFQNVAPYLSKGDLTIGNLETTLPGEPRRYSGYPQFGAPDSIVTALKNAGFDILTTSNNHSMDKGGDVLARTLNVLREHEMLHLGTWRSPEEFQKNRVLVVQKKGFRLAFLNYTYGTNGIPVPENRWVNLIDKKQISKDIEIAETLAPDLVIVLFHYGGEYRQSPDAFQIEMTNHAFYRGADVVIGGHPHTLQPYEIKQVTDVKGRTKERFVIYSMGNFISAQRKRYTDGGAILNLTITRKKDQTNGSPLSKSMPESAPKQKELSFKKRTSPTPGQKKDSPETAPLPVHSRFNYTPEIIPVWVYLARGRQSEKHDAPKTRSFRILPVDEHASPEKIVWLPPRAQKKLRVFAKDTQKMYKVK